MLWLAAPATGQQPTDRDEAERQLAAVETEIAELQQRLSAARTAHGDAQAELQALDLELQAAARGLREVETRRAEQRAQLDALEIERERQLDDLGERHEQLTEQLRAAYRQGSESRLKLLLNQDDPQRLTRTLAYYDYLNRAQTERMAALRESLADLDALQREIDAELLALAAVEEERAAAHEVLVGRRDERATMIAALNEDIGAGEAQLAELEANRRDLETLIERLGDALADIPLALGDTQPVSSARGALPMPVSGRVVEAFGRPRGAGLTWEGWLIAARPGDEVRAVARGRVAYADWLRGYGLLMIVEHGEGYMSLYGHNESLLREVGEWVSPGDVLATVGQGPNGRDGLYFEWRRDGEVLDPAAWIQR